MLKPVTDKINGEANNISTHINGSLFHLEQLQANKNTTIQLIEELLLMDANASVTSCFANATELFRSEAEENCKLPSRLPLTFHLHQHNRIRNSSGFSLSGMYHILIFSDAKLEKDIDNRLAKANKSFGRLYKHI